MPARVTRIAVVGCSGSGKTTAARALARDLGLIHCELDSIFHGSEWTPNPNFLADVAAVTDTDGWVVDGNYSQARDLVWGRAQIIVALDYSWFVAMHGTVTRTLRRMFTREELWNGNRESIRNLARLDPRANIVLWTATQHRRYRRMIVAQMASPQWQGTPMVRLRSRAETRRWAADFVAAQRRHN